MSFLTPILKSVVGFSAGITGCPLLDMVAVNSSAPTLWLMPTSSPMSCFVANPERCGSLALADGTAVGGKPAEVVPLVLELLIA